MKTYPALRSWLPCVAALLLPFGAQAALISYEGFAGSLGNLSGQHPSGWNGAWTVPALYLDDSQVVTGSLTYPTGVDLTPTGNRLSFTGTGDRSVSAAYGSAFQYETGTPATRYASVLINKSLGHYLLFQLSNDAHRWSFGVNGSNQFLLRTHNGTSIVADTSTALLSANTTYLLVSKLEVRSDGTQSVYLNWYADGDVIPTDEPTSWMLTATTSNSETTLNTTLTILRGGSANAALIDEIRLGSDWAAVAPASIPEPGALALLTLAAGGFLLRSRRK